MAARSHHRHSLVSSVIISAASLLSRRSLRSCRHKSYIRIFNKQIKEMDEFREKKKKCQAISIY
jgi:hypothetical protein